MNPRGLELTGAWFQVGGNTIAAIGTTRGFIGEENVEEPLVIVGGSLQALGYILQSIALINSREKQGIQIVKNELSKEEQIKRGNQSLEETGIELLALGNVSNVIGTFFNIQKETEENDYLIITGNSLQSIGAFVGGEVALNEEPEIPWLIVVGNSLQTLGAGLQAYQGIHNLSKEKQMIEKNDREKEDERLVGLIGIWIQAIGTAIGITQMVEE
ncbi:AraC family transcriptional regulator [Bacillus pseudomycoides]|uniref:AraC family transcriptional regulator n=1 Tax=Bacillus bingmayongensis TaxID=1150157 RepID=A0ABU5K0R2_9BACI|nr:AraC family transcriptional regulator [Bacillus pseudomycoides]